MKQANCLPVHEALGVAPVDGAHYLRRPPAEVGLENLAVVRAGLEHVPESAALGIVHDEVEVGRRLECT